MRKIILILLSILLLASISFADRNATTTTGYNSSTLIKRGDWKVYRISWHSTASEGCFGIYDTLGGLNELSNTNVKTEDAEATAFNGEPMDFVNKPLEGSTGLYLYIKDARVVVEYE